MAEYRSLRQLRYGSVLFGVGLAGAFDGIVFHQLLQWHSVYMHTHRFGQIVSDGLFHAFTVIALAAGGVLLWKAGPPAAVRDGWRRLVGGAFLGAGGFNFIEGIVNHHLLQVHHVRQGHPYELWYDLAFLASGILLAGIGIAVRGTSRRRDGRRAAA